MSPKIRVLVADGQPMMREGLRISLERSGQVEIVAEAEDGYASALAASSQRPDVAILDAGLRKLECHDAVLRIRAQCPETRILVMFVSNELAEIQDFVEAGVRGFIAKTAMPQEYQAAILALMSGGTCFSGPLASQLFERRKPAGLTTNIFGLTGREIEILRLICGGFSNKDTARRLELSVRTIETHRLNLRRKTGAGRLRDLVRIAQQLGIAEKAVPEQISRAATL